MLIEPIMAKCPNSDPTYYQQKDHKNTVLNEVEDPLHYEAASGKTSVSDIHEEPPEDRPYTCEGKEIQVTIPCSTMSERHFSSKIVLSPGLKGSRPHFSSICTLNIESMELLSTSFLEILNCSQLFAAEKVSTDLNYKIGSFNTELEKALEVALLDMFEGERCQIILHASNREKKLRDQEVSPTPCLKCTVHLKRITPSTVLSNVEENYFLSPFNLSEEKKCSIALDEKNQGVELFKKGQYVDAFHRFAWGCKILMTVDCLLIDNNSEKNKTALNLYSILCSNMAECQLKEDNPTLAMILCKKAIALDPSNVKALYRQAYASWILGDVDQAHDLLKEVLKLDSNNVAAKHLMGEVQAKLKRYSDEYTKMMKRIFQI